MSFHGSTVLPMNAIDSAQLSDLRDAAPDPIRWAFLAAVHLLHVGRASLLVFREDERDMTVAASVGIDPAVVPTIRVPLGAGIAGLVAERDMAVIGEAQGTTYLSVPIHTPRGVVGVLNMTNRLDGRNLNDADLDSVRTIADHLGYLLQQATESGLDPSTGLPDRWAFDEIVHRELARSARTAEAFGIVVVRLKGVEQSVRRVGQQQTSAIIRDVGEHLRPIIRRYDVIGWRGDGFALLFPGANHAPLLAERVRAAATGAVRPLESGMGVDVGWVHGPAEGKTAEALFIRAAHRAQEAQTVR